MQSNTAPTRRRTTSTAAPPLPMVSRAGRLGLVLLAAWIAACAPAVPPAPGGRPLLYAVSAGDGTIVRMDAASGRLLGAADIELPPPLDLVGGGGRLLATSWRTTARPGSATVLSPAETRGPAAETATAEWAARPVVPEPGADVAFAASDGGDYAALVYGVRADEMPPYLLPPACVVATVDLRTAQTLERYSRCAEGDGPILAAALALRRAASSAPGGTRRIAYLSVRGPLLASGRWPATGGLVAVDMVTGAELGAAPLPGIAIQLLIGESTGAGDEALYAVVAQPDPAAGSDERESVFEAASWLLVRVSLADLAVEQVQPLPARPLWLTLAPGGTDAYAVGGAAELLYPSPLWHLDLIRTGCSVVATLPPAVMGLAVTTHRIYAADPFGNGILVLDRATGRLLQVIKGVPRPMRLLTAGQY